MLIGGLVVATRVAAAQTGGPPPDSTRAATPQVTRDSAHGSVAVHEPLFTVRDAYIAAGFAVATIALSPLDRRIAGELQEPDAQANRLLHHLSTDVRLIAQPGALLIGTSMYAVGRIGHIPRAADLGLHGTEALLVGSGISSIIKGFVGRARPYAVSDTSPFRYQFLRGFRKGTDYSSFPSGHSTAGFAAAAAVTSETSRWWPRSTWYIAPVLYGGATAVALSRMYNNKHWASDVVVGAAIGTFAGRKVVQWHHTHPKNKLDRWLLGTSVAGDGRGNALVMWHATTR